MRPRRGRAGCIIPGSALKARAGAFGHMRVTGGCCSTVSSGGDAPPAAEAPAGNPRLGEPDADGRGGPRRGRAAGRRVGDGAVPGADLMVREDWFFYRDGPADQPGAVRMTLRGQDVEIAAPDLPAAAGEVARRYVESLVTSRGHQRFRVTEVGRNPPPARRRGRSWPAEIRCSRPPGHSLFPTQPGAPRRLLSVVVRRRRRRSGACFGSAGGTGTATHSRTSGRF